MKRNAVVSALYVLQCEKKKRRGVAAARGHDRAGEPQSLGVGGAWRRTTTYVILLQRDCSLEGVE